MNNSVEFYISGIRKETEKAILIEYTHFDQGYPRVIKTWLPKSQIEWVQSDRLRMSRWLYNEKIKDL